MAIAKNRGVPRQPELFLEKYINKLDGIPDEATLGRLQSILEILLSERSHPMIVGLSKQLEQLRTAENIIQREIEGRKIRDSANNDRSSGEDTTLKRKYGDVKNEEDPTQNVGIEDSKNRKTDTHEKSLRNFDLERTEERKPERDQLRSDDDEDIEENEKEEQSRQFENERNTEVDSTDDAGTGKDKNDYDHSYLNKSKVDSQSSNLEIDNAEAKNEVMEEKENDKKENSQALDILPHSKEIPHNKKFVANPKSEFVGSQSLPYHTFGIFNEDNDDQDEEMYKRRLGVVSYPKEDLSTLTAGPVPMEDYTRAKPSNQVQFSTYATFLEPYFRQFTDEDIQFLQQPAVGSGVEAANLRGGKRLSPYTMPPLGPDYHLQWAEQDAEMAKTDPNSKQAFSNKASSLLHLYQPKGSVVDLNEQSIESAASSVSLGPFTERLVAAVMPEVYETTPTTPSGTGISNTSSDGFETNVDNPSYAFPEKAIAAIPPAPSGSQAIDDFVHLEERVKGEFRYVGVLDMSLMRRFEREKNNFKLALPQSRDDYVDPSTVDVDWVNGSEDDEVSRELRLLQEKLKEVSRRNTIYKARLLPVVQEQLAWQEYQSILQDLDKQVDQAYQKRLKQPKVPAPKQKKRKDSVLGVDSPGTDGASPYAASTPEALSISKIPDQKPAIKALIDKRERWISKIGPLFKPNYEMMREYEIPKFANIDDDDAADDDDEEERDE